MSPQTGDVITTAEELDALPEGAAVVCAGLIWTRYAPEGWGTAGGLRWTSPSFFFRDHDAATLVYLPGQPPRPERVVKAEALREAAGAVYGDERAEGPHGHPLSIATWLHERAARIERGEP